MCVGEGKGGVGGGSSDSVTCMKLEIHNTYLYILGMGGGRRRGIILTFLIVVRTGEL